jgi:AcrR family transcriptional regulator
MASTTRPTGSRGYPETADRRVRKSQTALREAFVSLVLEHGYEAVTIEEIAERADVARATFYKHFADKEELLTSLFEQLAAEVTERIQQVEGAPTAVRTALVRELYRHAEQYRDVYLVCLRGAGHGRSRHAYIDLVAGAAEAVFAERVRASKVKPVHDLSVLGRAYAGAHVALLEAWLEDEDRGPFEPTADRQTELLTNGWAWALGMIPREMADALPSLDSVAPPKSAPRKGRRSG